MEKNALAKAPATGRNAAPQMPAASARLTGTQARRFLSPHMSAAKFYEIVRAFNVPRHEFGPRCMEFDLAVMEELRAFFFVRTPADAKRVADGRRKFSWSP